MNDKCTMCGQEGLVKLSSQNAKVCTGCGHEEAWPLEVGQQPLVGSHRQKSGTPVKNETVLDDGGCVVEHTSPSQPASLEELIGKPEERQHLPHPMQPIVFDDKNVVRFKQNAIVDWLFQNGRVNMNELAYVEFPAEDRMQFAQLLGYSVSGYGALSYVTEASRDRADQIAEAMGMGELLSAAELPLQSGKPQFDPIFMAIAVLGKSSHQSIMRRIDCLPDHKINMLGHQLDHLVQRIAPEDSVFSNIQAELRSLSNTIAATHTCYEKGDEGCPQSILDRNGDVVLGLCKHCGAGESELSQQVCTGPKPYKILEKGEQVYTGPQIIEFKMSTDTEANQALLRSYLSNLGLTQDAIISAAPSPQDTAPRPDPDYIRRSYRFADVCEANYLQLALVLQRAHDQAAYGKGKDRHAKGQPFHEQRMQAISQLLDSPDGMAYQVLKKVTEGLELPTTERKVAELLGAINYLAGIVIFLESKDRASAINIIAGEV